MVLKKSRIMFGLKVIIGMNCIIKRFPHLLCLLMKTTLMLNIPIVIGKITMKNK